MKKFIMSAAILALPMAAFAASPVVKPGQWQLTTKTEMAGAPIEIPPTTVTMCITKEEAETAEATIPKGRGDCKMLDYKLDGNKASWKMDCTSKRGGKITGTGEVTYSSAAYDGKMHMTISNPQGEQEINSTFHGKHISDTCTK